MLMEAGQIYHIYNRANGSENLFKEAENYRYFLKQYAKHIYPVAETYAYCLLPNHFHFLLKIKDFRQLKDLPGFGNLEGLAEKQVTQKTIGCFSNFFNSYTKAFNKRFGRTGSLFEKNFKRKLVESDNQFQETFLYINLNPVKHGLVSHANSWPWSSWKSYLKPGVESLLGRKHALTYFDNLDNLKYCIDEKKEVILNMNMG